ncbi:MAG: hypothetical protein JW953_12220 [Anaerolineae bacterium]|nr:hypothetical protein [Anaerolineae bacterium]
MSNPLPTAGLQMTIAYLHLMAFCPPEYIWHLKASSEPLRQGLAKQAGLSPEEYLAKVLPEACRRIVAFHQDTKEPDEAVVMALTTAATEAETSPEAAWRFSQKLASLAEESERAKAKNRLQGKKGCQFCQSPCAYGFFTMVSKPNYDHLRELLEAETKKSLEEQDVVNTVWSFAMGHLWRTLGIKQAYISADHLGNLGYCLLTLGTAKSRYPFAANKMETFQQANQVMIKNWGQNGQDGNN